MLEHIKSFFSSQTRQPASIKPTSAWPRLISASENTQGAVGAASGDDAFAQYTKMLNWISDTKKKMPSGSTYTVTPEMREEASHTDPLVSGIITPFLKNIILGSHNIVTKDNKKYAAMIEDINQFLEDVGLMEVLREDFKDCAIIHGHSYRRKDYSPGNILEKLQRLEPRGMKTYEDPWDSLIVAYHQKVHVREAFSSTNTLATEYNSWFIPGGEKYIPDKQIGTDSAKATWDDFREKYHIDETTNLRVDSAEKILAIHKVREGDPAPIEAAMLSIWLKRLLLANAPNLIISILYPFIHVKNGKLFEVTLQDGGKQIISSVPENPPAGMATTDPERYSAMKAAYDDYIKAIKDDVENIARYRAEGGMFSSGPDKEIQVIESGRSINTNFVQSMISVLNEDIGQAFGFPVSLVMARGSELSTTRAIQDLFLNVYSSLRREYEQVANSLIEERFEGQTWRYSVTKKDGTVEEGEYTFKDTNPSFVLETGDVKDALIEAQTRLTDMQMLEKAKLIGTSKTDVQALADERGFGILDLDRYDQATPQYPGMFGLAGNSDLDSAGTGKQDLRTENIKEDDRLKNELLKTYQETQKELMNMLGE